MAGFPDPSPDLARRPPRRSNGGARPSLSVPNRFALKEVVQLASNQEEAYREARDARVSAEKAGVSGRDLKILEATEASRKATRDSATGGSSGWGILG